MNEIRSTLTRAVACGLLSVLSLTGFSTIVITDTEPTTKAVTAASGEKVEIRGNGLTANCTLTLAGNNTVQFYTTATIAAPITATGAITLVAESGKTGTIAGGATFSGEVTVRTGNINVTTKGVTCSHALTFLGGHLTIANCTWMHTSRNVTGINLGNASQVEDACFEIAAGGTFTITEPGGNRIIYVGRKANLESRFLVNGGRFNGGYDGFWLNYENGEGNAIVEIKNGGVFSSRRCGIDADSTKGTSKIILGEGGTFYTYESYYNCAIVRGTGNVTLALEGRATLDFSAIGTAKPCSDNGGTANVTWTCTSAGRLSVIGRTDGQSNLTLHNIPNDFRVGYLRSAGTLTLANPANALSLAVGYLPDHVTTVVSQNAGCSLTLDRILPEGYSGMEPIPTADLTRQMDGFASVAFRNLIVDSASTPAYLSPTCVNALPGKLIQMGGQLILDTHPGSTKFTKNAGTLYLQDTNPYVMRNTSKYVGLTGGWLDPNDVKGPWVQGAVAEIDTKANSGDVDGNHIAYALRVGGGNFHWDQNTGRFELGSGGLVFTSPIKWSLCSNGWIPRIVLRSNQTWTNESTDGRAYMLFGMTYAVPNYHKAYVKADEGVTAWRLTGDFETWLYSPSNDLKNVTVTVESPARLRLISRLDARLNAKALALKGADMAFGADTPWDMLGPTAASVAAIDETHLAPEVQLKDGGTLTASVPKVPFAVPTVVATGSGNRILGETGNATVVFTQAVTTVSVPATSDWLGLDAKVEGDAPAFVVTGSGTFSIKYAMNAAVTFRNGMKAGGTLELTGDGFFAGTVTNAGNLVVNTTGTIVMPDDALVDYGGTTITVSSGMLALSDASSIPEGVTIVTRDTGAFMLVDPSGFDPITQMGGTKNLVSPGGLIVTDIPREHEKLVVGDGQVLQIFGSGLKDSSTVLLNDGATVRFYKTATVYAPVTSTNNVTFEAVRDVVGRFEAPYQAYNSSTARVVVRFVGDGTVDFGGSLDFTVKTIVPRVDGGHLLVSGKHMTTRTSMQLWAGEVAFTNAEFYLGMRDGTAYMDLASESQWGDVKVSFLAGSYWYQGNNQYVMIGRNNNVESRLVLDGGKWDCETYDQFRLCPQGSGNGVLEIKSGTFRSNRLITSKAAASYGGKARFIWSGGTITGMSNSYKYFYPNLLDGNFDECRIAGDCTLDLNLFTNSVITLFKDATTNRLRTDLGARLTIVSDNSTVGYCNRVQLNGLEDGLIVNLKRSEKNGDVTVEVPDCERPVGIGWTLGGEGKVVATGTTTGQPIVPSYYVETGDVFAQKKNYNTWHEGFTGVEGVSNLVFETGSTYLFPVVNERVTTMSLSGALVLPDTMAYAVDSDVRPAMVVTSVLIDPAQGIVGEDCVWTCGGGVSEQASRVWTEGGRLLFKVTSRGACVIFR